MSFEDVLNDYAALLSRVASSYEANTSLQQELYQEICIAVWQSLASFKGDSSLKTYVLRVAHNRSITHVSKEAKRFKSSPNEDAATTADKSMFEKSEANLEISFIQSQQLSAMLKVIRQLKLPARQVITLFLEGLSYEEIADISGLSKSNVGVMITRIKQQLRGQISDE